MDMTEVILEQVRFWRDAGNTPHQILESMGDRHGYRTNITWGDVITRMEQFYLQDSLIAQADRIASEGYENAHTEQYNDTIITSDG